MVHRRKNERHSNVALKIDSTNDATQMENGISVHGVNKSQIQGPSLH